MGIKKCKKLGNRATQRELKEAHIARMEMKAIKREHNQRDMRPEHIFANISKHHEHYGDTPLEHAQRKNNS